ncbi:cation-transporting ATPase pacL [Asticcacaulis biprosthecium C19]|uniref:Cation-transporting ATPase pacL n=1 Tax=Asticcacaulis biprosthecium C19 TaxID=715226 RepID=F4QTF9_9CAUL|nr:cation-transporting ATPase pacL [Asticcacaulis biprosthecium C19]
MTARLATHGFNELPSKEKRAFLSIVLTVAREPMMMLLLAAGLLYLLLGDTGEALILLIFAGLSMAITVTQEFRTEHVLAALRDLTSPRALVIRGGVRKIIAGREVVPGDLIVVEEGSRIPADADLFESHDLKVDESLLTGESVPVYKTVGTPDIYSGTLVVRGTGLAIVTATGISSRIGRIGSTLNTLTEEPPRLLAETRRLVRLFATGAGAICLTMVILYGFLRNDWLQGILAGIALAMAMLPEEFPVVLTVFIAMGAWRISRARVLTRRAATIETLGTATVLCTDKTGTLTENRMAVARMQVPSGEGWTAAGAGTPPSQEMSRLALMGLMASDREPYDPMELAFHTLGHSLGAVTDDNTVEDWQLLRAYGLRPDLLAMTQVWQTTNGSLVAATKGAPEAVAELCRLDAATRRHLLNQADEMAAEGLRVLAVASATLESGDLPPSHRDLPLVFMGLVGLADPLRAGVAEAVAEAGRAGIRVIMITGDYPVTARAIAQQAGLNGNAVMTGDVLRAMDDEALAACVRATNIFARIAPEQKLRIVEALKRQGEVVAMTGDGVNDAPSLKTAHIGIAMGGRGTDVAREASSLVLLDDDFGSIVTAIRLGRRIHDNLRKAMCFIVAVHVPIAGLALLPLIFGLPILLGPVHIALLEMVIDPICSLVFENEPEEKDIMQRPPAATDAPLLSLPLLLWSVFQGAILFVLVASPVLILKDAGETVMRGTAFLTLVLAVVSLTLINRSFSASILTALRRPNPMLAAVVVAVTAGLSLAFLWPWARNALNFGKLGLSHLAIAAVLAGVALVALEATKVILRRALPGKSRPV